MAKIVIESREDGSIGIDYEGGSIAVLGLLRVAVNHIEREVFSIVSVQEEERET